MSITPTNGDARPEQLRPLQLDSANQKAAGAGAHDGKLLTRCSLFVDQPFGSSDEVVERGMPLDGLPSQVPLFAIFTAATDIRYRQYAAELHPTDVVRVERGDDRIAVAAVAKKQCPMRPIFAHSATSGDSCMSASSQRYGSGTFTPKNSSTWSTRWVSGYFNFALFVPSAVTTAVGLIKHIVKIETKRIRITCSTDSTRAKRSARQRIQFKL